MSAPNTPERFWGRVEIGIGCWPINFKPIKFGYRRVKWRGVHILAHRLAWQLANGPIPDGMRVLHHCDNPACVRPDHLFLGTQLDNIADMKAKGRAANRAMRDPAYVYQRATHCRRGHGLEGNRHQSGQCLTCHREADRMRKRAMRAAAKAGAA